MALAGFGACAGSPSPPSHLPSLVDLDGRSVDPQTLAREAGTAAVFLFTRADCPISNRYAPEVRRLAQLFGPQGVRVALVYPNPDATVDDIREHLERYGYASAGEPSDALEGDSLLALRDPDQAFAFATGAEITPEAVVLDGQGRLVYRGRIDDRWVAFGQLREEPTRRDVEEVLTALAAGESVDLRTTQAVGCLIEDLS